MLLATAPNVSKTALALQLGLDVVRHSPQTCLLVLSLEMPRADLVRRLRCNLFRLGWRSLTPEMENEADRQALEATRQELVELGRRILILNEENFPQARVTTILERLA
ncbi:hypothetical protein DFAR_3760004 [Desulfarculales bacterium]